MKIAKVFKNGQSQAVRLPKEYRVEGNEIYIKKMGNVTMLIPKNDPWGALLSGLKKFSPDYLPSRDQPEEQQKREDLFK